MRPSGIDFIFRPRSTQRRRFFKPSCPFVTSYACVVKALLRGQDGGKNLAGIALANTSGLRIWPFNDVVVGKTPLDIARAAVAASKSESPAKQNDRAKVLQLLEEGSRPSAP